MSAEMRLIGKTGFGRHVYERPLPTEIGFGSAPCTREIFSSRVSENSRLNTLGVSGAVRAIGGKACSSKDGGGERDSERADDGQQAA